MKLSLILAALSAVTINSLAAQTPAAKLVDSARVEIDKAVIANDTAQLGKAVTLLDSALGAFPNDPYVLHYRGYARYHQAINAMSTSVQAASRLIEMAVADLQLSSNKLQWPETWSLLYALDGYRIAVDPSQGMTLGPEIGELAARARQLGPNNPRVLYMEAVGTFRTPVEYGGGAGNARVLLDRALKEFETDKPAPLAPAWGREAAAKFKKELDKGAL